jgi:hypothetical protein
MKVLAINGSPHMQKGNTALILGPFLEGMREAGAEVELLYTSKLDIKPCLGCFSCWIKTPGRCVHEDDMSGILVKLREADIWVWATPLYFDGVSGPLKNLIDRLTPLLRSNCGLWEMENFDPLVAHIAAVCQHVKREFAGALLRPHGGTLRDLLKLGEPVDDVLDAAREAGRQLVRVGKMSTEALATVGQELITRDDYITNMNQTAEKLLGGGQQK